MNIFNYSFLFDSHAHLGGSPEEVSGSITNAQKAEVKVIFDIGVDLKSSKQAVERAKVNKGIVFAFAGIDPDIFIPGSTSFFGNDLTEDFFEISYKSLFKLVKENLELVKGIGETGIDRYWLKNIDQNAAQQSIELQTRLFKTHLELAQLLKLPLTIHSRGAEEECLSITQNYSVAGVFHSYTGSLETAKRILGRGFGLGVNGIITFKNAQGLREVYKRILGDIPKDADYEFFYKRGIYFETDSPFLSPEGSRGGKNSPANTRTIFEYFRKYLET